VGDGSKIVTNKHTLYMAEETTLDEGHGFSRAAINLNLRGL